MNPSYLIRLIVEGKLIAGVLVRFPAVPGSLSRVKPGTRDVFSEGRTCFEKAFSRIMADL